MDDKNSQEYFKESGLLPTMKKIIEMDRILIEKDKEIMLKIGEIGTALGAIGRISGESNCEINTLRKTCLSVMESLEKERKEKKKLNETIHSLEQKYKNLKDEKAKLDSDWKEEFQKQRESIKQIQEEYGRFFENEKVKKEQAEAKLDIEKQNVSDLEAKLKNEQKAKKCKAEEVEKLTKDLDVKNNQISELEKKVEQFQSKEGKMPALMKLYDVYNKVMEEKKDLPKAFTDHLQRVVPMDDFDSFLEKVFKRLFPINYYQSIQAFIARCDQSGEISDEDKKEALRISDSLLRAVFAYGSKYYGEEKLFRMDDIKAGDKFDSGLCIYIDRKGTMFGNIAEVLLHGIRDEKNNKIYHYYVEGE